MKEFRFGVHALAPSGHDEWVTLARQVEDSGFSVLTVPDHLVDGCVSPFAALGVAAEATSSLRLGMLVLNNEFRHPALVAREVLTLDLLTGGRVELGLGAGSAMSAPEHESIGVAFDDGLARVARLSEAVEVLDGLLRGDRVSFSGDHYRLIDHRAWPPPTQRPRPPILVGGSGRRLLQMAAERVDIVSLSGIGSTSSGGRGPDTSGFSPDAVDRQVALVRAASGGRDLELQALVQRVILTDDPRGTAQRAQQRLPGLSIEDTLGSPYLWIGTVDSIGEAVLAARERWGLSYFSVFHDSVQAVAPIVARLGGT